MGEPVKVEEIQVEPPKSCEARIKTLYASVCHTDILLTMASQSLPAFPRVLGHEGVGCFASGVGHIFVIMSEQVCNNIEILKEGDLVIPTFLGECQDCENCLSGKTTCALNTQYPSVDLCLMHFRMTARGQMLYHSFSCSTWSGFLSCGFSTGFGAAWKEVGVEKGSSVAVLLVKELTGGMGVDYCFECTGVAPLVNEALQATKNGKRSNNSNWRRNHATVEINFLSLVFGGNLKGSIFGGLRAKTDLPIIIDKCKNKEIQLDELLTHEVRLEDIDKAFEQLKQPDCVKVLIKLCD
ncbi:hypothetical protein I3760_Q011800 [Carya illinoinensis]|nr:hypothetical protein I3760_Q011800 [Carya illinoinensis]